MKKTASLGMLAAAGALAIAAPAGAKPAAPTHRAHPAKCRPTHPAKSHKCSVHRVAYTASGTLVSFTAAPTSDGTYSGTMTVHVTKANHHARPAKAQDMTYTLDHAKVDFGKGANPPVAGDRVKVIGKITKVSKRCTDQTGAGTITLRKVDIRTAPPHQK